MTTSGMISAVCLQVLALFAGPAVAQGLPDPTRPAIAEDQPAGAPVTAALVLQSVLVSEHRSVAVINGQLVPLGGRIGGFRLIRIDGSSVELARAGAQHTLHLLGDIGKRPVKVTTIRPMNTEAP